MNQSQIEHLIHPKHIRDDIKQNISETFKEHFLKASIGLRKWLNIEEFESKNKRKSHVLSLDIHELILDIVTSITIHAQKPMPFASIISMSNIPGMDKLSSVQTVAEIVAVLEPLGLYSIEKYPDGTRTVESNIELNEQLLNRLNLYCYLPPMIEKPDTLEHNKSSGYKTINSDSLILGYSENCHKNSISLDVLNTLNKTQYVLDTDFISKHVKEWHRKELTTDEMLAAYELYSIEHDVTYEQFIEQYQQDCVNWENYLNQFNTLKTHLEDKPIYFTHKVDKRGRVYSQAFHFNYQGTSFEKACISLARKEVITGEL